MEESGEAFRDLKRNIAANRIGNVKAVCSRIERFRLSGVYSIAGIEAHDFFPQTHHVETPVVLERFQ